jgi:acetolactate synthase-1/2/3 large subunit
VRLTGFPITSTLQGLGAFPGDDNQFIGMLGMHGTYEANMAMHDCDLLINIGARFDDRITGKVDEFSPNSKKIHVDIDPSSINKTIDVDVPLVGDVAHVLEDAIKLWKSNVYKTDKAAVKNWWNTIDKWKSIDSLGFKNDKKNYQTSICNTETL